MSKKSKLLRRFLSKPVDFEFRELRRLLSHLGYEEQKLGKTSGSRVAFYNENTKHIIRLHRPHPTGILKIYQLNQLIEELEKQGVI